MKGYLLSEAAFFHPRPVNRPAKTINNPVAARARRALLAKKLRSKNIGLIRTFIRQSRASNLIFPNINSLSVACKKATGLRASFVQTLLRTEKIEIRGLTGKQ